MSNPGQWSNTPPQQRYVAAPPQYVNGVSKHDREWALYYYLGVLVLGWIGILVAWLIEDTKAPFVRHHMRAHMRLILSQLVWFTVFMVLIYGTVFTGVALADATRNDAFAALTFFGFLGYLPLIGLSIAGFVYAVRAIIDSTKGLPARYPKFLSFVGPAV